MPCPVRHTSPRIPGTRHICGILRSPLTGCPNSTSRGGGSLVIATPMFPIGRGGAALRLRAEITDRPHNTPARTAPRPGPTTWRHSDRKFGFRHSDVPYWTGRGGITPPGGNNGSPSQYACSNGSASGTNDLAAAYVACGGPRSVWFPDLRHGQAVLSVGVMVKF